MMNMNFWFDTNIGDLLFKGLTITSSEGLIFICFGLASLAIIFEAIKVQFASLKHATIAKRRIIQPHECPNECSLLLTSEENHTSRLLEKLPESIIRVGWYILQTIISYFLMLSVMTYNGYLLISVSLGAGLGYFIFGPVLMEIEMKYEKMKHSKRDCPACKAKAGDLDSTITEVTEAEGSIINSEATCSI